MQDPAVNFSIGEYVKQNPPSPFVSMLQNNPDAATRLFEILSQNMNVLFEESEQGRPALSGVANLLESDPANHALLQARPGQGGYSATVGNVIWFMMRESGWDKKQSLNGSDVKLPVDGSTLFTTAQVYVLPAPKGEVILPVELPLEASDVESYVIHRKEEDSTVTALRREAALVRRYSLWKHTDILVRHSIALPGGSKMYTDAFDKSANQLIEAKSSASRLSIRTALGQILDYGRWFNGTSLSLLLPDRPVNDLIDLLHRHKISVIWEKAATFVEESPT